MNNIFSGSGVCFLGKPLMNCKLIADCKEYKITKGFIKGNASYQNTGKPVDNEG